MLPRPPIRQTKIIRAVQSTPKAAFGWMRSRFM